MGSVLPWVACIVTGIALIIVGIALHTRPEEIGGPVMLGIILVVGGAARLLRGGSRAGG
jgi:hypothetical protein